MHMYNPPYALWSIWRQLSILNHGLVLILGAAFGYSVFLTVRTILRLRSVCYRQNENAALVREKVAALVAGYAKVQQVIGTAFYLFGMVLFLGMENIGYVLADGKELPGTYVLDNFLLQCAFAANVFLIFLVLHLIQWLGSTVLSSLSRRSSLEFLE
jgi:hypothetical protein